MTSITYEPGTYRRMTLEYRLQKDKEGNAYIEHRVINSQWWDIAYGNKCHTQEAWDNIKKTGHLVKP